MVRSQCQYWHLANDAEEVRLLAVGMRALIVLCALPPDAELGLEAAVEAACRSRSSMESSARCGVQMRFLDARGSPSAVLRR